MLVVVPELKLETFRAFVDYARSNPGRLSYGSVGSGSASHLTMELLKSEAKLYAVHIPYRGFPPAVTDMLAGNIQAMFAIIPGVLPHVRAGKMKALAITALKRNMLAHEGRLQLCRRLPRRRRGALPGAGQPNRHHRGVHRGRPGERLTP